MSANLRGRRAWSRRWRREPTAVPHQERQFPFAILRKEILRVHVLDMIGAVEIELRCRPARDALDLLDRLARHDDLAPADVERSHVAQRHGLLLGRCGVVSSAVIVAISQSGACLPLTFCAHSDMIVVDRAPSMRSASQDSITYGSSTGVHITCSIRVAPVASITSRSKPSATPQAGGIVRSAAMKSSSIG